MLNTVAENRHGSGAFQPRPAGDMVEAVKSRLKGSVGHSQCHWLIDYLNQERVINVLGVYGVEVVFGDDDSSVAFRCKKMKVRGIPRTRIADCRNDLSRIFSNVSVDIGPGLRIIAQLLELERSYQACRSATGDKEHPAVKGRPPFEGKRLDANLDRLLERANTWIDDEKSLTESTLVRIFRTVLVNHGFPLTPRSLSTFDDLEKALQKQESDPVYGRFVPEIQSHLYLLNARFRSRPSRW